MSSTVLLRRRGTRNCSRCVVGYCKIAGTDPSQAFKQEMDSFFYLFTRYLDERAKSHELCVPFRFLRTCYLIAL